MKILERERELDAIPVSHREMRFSQRTAEAAAIWGAVALVVYAALRGVFGAASKPFWHDEICTLIMARQPDLTTLWVALKNAADSNPPLFYLIERACGHLTTNELIAFRIPSIVGFCCVLWCLFTFIRARTGDLVALLCTATVLATSMYGFMAEARPYSLVMACLSVALVCYQRAPALRWVLGMAAGLALAQALHHYALLAFAPFVVAESVLLWRSRSFRPAVWAALGCGLLPLIVSWPLLSQLRRAYGGHLWNKPSLQEALATYGDFLHLDTAWGIAAVFTSIVGVVFVWRSTMRSGEPGGEQENNFLQEPVLALTLLGLPLISLVVVGLAGGGVVSRYVLATVLGIPLAASYILPAMERRTARLFIVFLALLLGFQEVSFWRSHPGRSTSPARSVATLVNASGYPDLPVAISAGINFLPIAYYATPELKERLFFPSDPQRALAYMGTDNIEIELQILRTYDHLRVAPFSKATAPYSKFLLYSQRAAVRGDWWPTALAREGHSLQLVAADQDARIYLVNLNSDHR